MYTVRKCSVSIEILILIVDTNLISNYTDLPAFSITILLFFQYYKLPGVSIYTTNLIVSNLDDRLVCMSDINFSLHIFIIKFEFPTELILSL
jgi:hypothetical protein